MGTYTSEEFGYLALPRKNGKSTLKYVLKSGTCVIGSSLLSDIRIKCKSQSGDPFCVVIKVKDNGLAFIENKCEDPVLYNGSKLQHVQILKNNDKFIIGNREFLYIKPSSLTLNSRGDLISGRQKSNCKMSHVAVPLNGISICQSLSAVKARRTVLHEWRINSCSNIVAGKSLQMSQHESLHAPPCRSFPVKKKAGGSAAAALNTIEQQSAKRCRPMSLDGSTKCYKRPKSNKTILLNISSSSHDEVFDRSLYSNSTSAALSRSETGLSFVNSFSTSEIRGPRNCSSIFLDTGMEVSKRASFENRSKIPKLGLSLNKSEWDLLENMPMHGKLTSSKTPRVQDIGKAFTTAKTNRSVSSERSNQRSLYSKFVVRKSSVTPIARNPKSSITTPEVGKLSSNKLLENTHERLSHGKCENELFKPVNASQVKKEDGSASTESLNDANSIRGNKVLKFAKLQKSKVSHVRTKVQISPISHLSDTSGTPKLQESPSLRNVAGLKRILRTPRLPKSPHDLTGVKGVKKMFKSAKVQRSPINDSRDLTGVRKNLKTPRIQKSPRNDLREVRGVKQIFQTPKEQKSPINDLGNVIGLKKLFRTPRLKRSPQNDLTNVKGVENIFKTPTILRSPISDSRDVTGVSKALKTPRIQKSPKNDLRDVRGVKQIFQTPKEQRSPINDLRNVIGLKKIFRTPRLKRSPQNDLTHVKGVKNIFKTPKVQRSPINDLRDVTGVRQILKTPRIQRSPRNDLTDVRGVKQIFQTPMEQKSPINDLTDVTGPKKILRTPILNKSPRNDLTDIKGVKKLFKTPKVQRSPVNDLTDVTGVTEIFKTPRKQKSPRNDLTDVRGVKQIFQTPKGQKSPKNNSMDMKELFKTPTKDQKGPEDDLRDLREVKKNERTPKLQNVCISDLKDLRKMGNILDTQKAQKSPTDKLTCVEGIKEILKSPMVETFIVLPQPNLLEELHKAKKSPRNNLTNVGVKGISKTPKVEMSNKTIQQDLYNITDVAKFMGNVNSLDSSNLDDIDVLDSLVVETLKSSSYNSEAKMNNSEIFSGLIVQSSEHDLSKKETTEKRTLRNRKRKSSSRENAVKPEKINKCVISVKINENRAKTPQKPPVPRRKKISVKATKKNMDVLDNLVVETLNSSHYKRKEKVTRNSQAKIFCGQLEQSSEHNLSKKEAAQKRTLRNRKKSEQLAVVNPKGFEKEAPQRNRRVRKNKKIMHGNSVGTSDLVTIQRSGRRGIAQNYMFAEIRVLGANTELVQKRSVRSSTKKTDDQPNSGIVTRSKRAANEELQSLASTRKKRQTRKAVVQSASNTTHIVILSTDAEDAKAVKQNKNSKQPARHTRSCRRN